MNKIPVRVICLVAVLGVMIQIQYANAESLTISMPASCKSKKMNFCFDKSNYPTAIVESVLSDMKNFEVAKDDDVGHIGFVDRFGDSDNDDCRSQSTTDPIYYVADEAGNDRVVIQMDGKFEQRYSVMWCDKEGRMNSSTEHFLLSTVEQNKMSCENKYMNYDFLVLSSETTPEGKWMMERASVKIPVCCACRYEKDD